MEHRRQSGLLLRERDMPLIPDWETANKPLYDLRDAPQIPAPEAAQQDKEE